MFRPSRSLAALFVALVVAGCAADALNLAPEAPDRPWTAPTDEAGEIRAGEAPASTQPRAETFTLPKNERLAKLPAAEPGVVDPRKTYDLPELIDIAQSNNQLTRVAWNDARQAALLAGTVRASNLPRVMVSAVGGYSYTRADDTTTLGVAGFSLPPASSDKDIRLHGGVASVSLNWLLFDFGQRAARVEAAEQAVVAANVGFTAAHQQLIYDVSLAYYAYSADRVKVAANTRSLADARRVEAATAAKAGQGQATVVETADARQGVAQARLALTRSLGAQDDSYLRLISTLGVSPLTKMNVAAAQGRNLSPILAGKAEAIVSSALGRRPDVLAAYAKERASIANIRAAEADFLPKIFLSGSANYNTSRLSLSSMPNAPGLDGSANLNSGRYGGTALIGVSMPLYDGGLRDAMLRQAQSRAESATLQLARTRNEAIRQIVAANNALKTSLATHAAARELVAASSVSFDASLAAYASGVGAVTPLSLAQSRLVEARAAEADSYSAALAAAAALSLATGSLGSAPAR